MNSNDKITGTNELSEILRIRIIIKGIQVL